MVSTRSSIALAALLATLALAQPPAHGLGAGSGPARSGLDKGGRPWARAAQARPARNDGPSAWNGFGALAPVSRATRSIAALLGPRWSRNPGLEKQLDHVTASRAEEGHAVRLLVNGVESYPVRRAALEDADVVLYKTYIFADDKAGREMGDRLVGLAQAGKKVFLQVDLKGTAGLGSAIAGALKGLVTGKTPLPPHLKRLVDAGVVFIPSGRPTLARPFRSRDHDKYIVAWKQGEPARVIAGGLNTGDAYAHGGNLDLVAATGKLGVRDTDVALEGPAARRIVQAFAAAARFHGTPPSSYRQLRAALRPLLEDPAAFRPVEGGKARVRFVANRPTVDQRRIEDLWLNLLTHVPPGETVDVSSGYFLPNARLTSAIVDAAARGVRFRFMLNRAGAFPRSSFDLVALAARPIYRLLLSKAPAGAIRIYEWSGDRARGLGPIHQKVGSFGQTGPVLVKSSNLDPLSLRSNSEVALVIDDVNVRHQFRDMFEADLASGAVRELEPHAILGEGLVARTIQAGLRLIEPFL